MLTRRGINRAQSILSHSNRHNNNHPCRPPIPVVQHVIQPQHHHRYSRSYSIRCPPSSPPPSPCPHTTVTTTDIPSDELSRLNRTTANLYRILLRCIARTSSASSSTTMLQPSLSPQDYGRARILDADRCAVWSRRPEVTVVDGGEDGVEGSVGGGDGDSVVAEEIVAFFRRWDGNGDVLTHIRDELNRDDRDNDDADENDDDDDDDDDYNDDDDDELDFHPDRTLLVSRDDLRKALRLAFLRLLPPDAPAPPSSSSAPSFVLTKPHVVDLHRFAIQSLTLMENQANMWDTTSVRVDWERGIQVVATSRYIGKSQAGNVFVNVKEAVTKPKHRFAYRIRIEKFSTATADNDNTTNNDGRCAVQLLGRAWNITEDPSPTSPQPPAVVTVRAPTTGVVGHLPVLCDGELFEYTSGCELVGETGVMDGGFYMVWVDGETTGSARVGDPVEAMERGEEGRFLVEVGPFRLMVGGRW